MRTYKYIIIFGWLLFPILTNGQKKSNITLHADSTDKYILVYTEGNYSILIGYDAFTKSKILDSEYAKGNTIKYIDSMKRIRKIIYLNADSICTALCKTDVGQDFEQANIFQEAQSIVTNLIDSGNVKIFDNKNKIYLSKLVKKKKKWRSHSSWGYGHETRKGESWFYSDNDSHKIVFESLIYMQDNIKENLNKR